MVAFRAAYIALLAIGLAVAATPVVSGETAQTADELIRSLAGKTTRSFSSAESEEAKRRQALIESLRGKPTRAIVVEERSALADIARDKSTPSVDLEIYFDFDSATIAKAAVPQLVNLGQALSDPQFAGATFLIAGYTDATGGATYNQALSERRAEAVKEFLASGFGRDPKGLIAVGFGQEDLRNTADPTAAENRRVQVINVGG